MGLRRPRSWGYQQPAGMLSVDRALATTSIEETHRSTAWRVACLGRDLGQVPCAPALAVLYRAVLATWLERPDRDAILSENDGWLDRQSLLGAPWAALMGQHRRQYDALVGALNRGEVKRPGSGADR